MFKTSAPFNVSVWLLRVTGLVAIFGVPFKRLPESIETWLPFNPDSVSHIIAIFIGVMLLYVASQLARLKRSAYVLGVTLLTALILFELLHHQNILQISLYALVLINLFATRSIYVVKSDITSRKRGIYTTLGVALVLISLISTTFIVIDQKEFGVRVSTRESYRLTVNALRGQQIPANLEVSREDIFLVNLIRAVGITAVIVIIWSLFRPLQLRSTTPKPLWADAELLLQKYSSSSEDFFKLWPKENKHLYFYDDSFVAYGVKNGTAYILDGCSGNPKKYAKLRNTFMDECRVNGWNIMVLHADAAEKKAWEKLGLDCIYIGSEARVDIADFANIERNKHFRYVVNKARKENLQVEIWQAPLSAGKIAMLQQISNTWLQTGDRREYQFIMGYFDEDYLRGCTVAVLMQNSEPIAYTNVIPTYSAGAYSVDHMRFTAGIPSISMHYLFMELIGYLREHAGTSLNLGLAPLSKMDDNAQTVPERLLVVVKRFGSRYYSFSGLEQFKNKFSPQWEPRYLLYGGGITALPQMAIGASSLTSFTRPQNRFKQLFIVLATVAGIFYAAFPLAFILNPNYALHGLVSILETNGQPYSWLFKYLDIVSGILLTALFSWVFIKKRKSLTTKLAISALLVSISSLGTVIAALVALPNGFEATTHISVKLLTNPSIVIHGLASAIDTLCFIAAVILWYVALYLRKRPVGPSLLTGLIVASSTVGFFIGQAWPSIGYGIQRFEILLFAIWIYMYATDIARLVFKKSK